MIILDSNKLIEAMVPKQFINLFTCQSNYILKKIDEFGDVRTAISQELVKSGISNDQELM